MATSEILVETPDDVQTGEFADLQIVTHNPTPKDVVVDTINVSQVPSTPVQSQIPSSPRPNPSPQMRSPFPPQPKLKQRTPKPQKVVFKQVKRPRTDTVRGFLDENPDFADELSATIPVSPTATKARTPKSIFDQVSPSSSQKPSTKKKTKRPPTPPPSSSSSSSSEQEEEEVDSDGEEEGGEEEEEDIAEEAEEDNEEEEVFGTPKSKKSSTGIDEEENDVHEKEASTPKPKLSPEDEVIRKMRLIEDIKDAARQGFMPPEQPHAGMPLAVLERIKRFQDEMMMQAMGVGLMGTGLVQLVGLLEIANEKFDPFSKILGTGLKLQGAKQSVEQNLDRYSIPLTKMYRRYTESRGGKPIEIPPWLEIITITGGILIGVHKQNVYSEAKKAAESEMRDPESLRKAHEIQQTFYDPRTPVSEVSTMSDADLEEKLAKEFAGFDKLPSLDSISRPDEASRLSTIAQRKQEFEEKKKAEDIVVNLTHKQPEPQEENIDLVQPPRDEEVKEEDDDENDDDEDDSDESEETGDETIIKIPLINPSKKLK